MAWEEIYAAEGSDWFWWLGADQSAPGGDKPYETAFTTHLRNMYKFADRAGAALEVPAFDPIIADDKQGRNSQGTMAHSRVDTQIVIFTCNASAQKVPRAVYIAGNLPQLADWTPNVVAMHDDGVAGDVKASDGVWSLRVAVAVGTEIQYKYTNSGERGSWMPSEEFPLRNRTVVVRKKTESPFVIKDTFGH